MLTIICGKTCSGKDSVVNRLVENYQFKRVITYTTRPMRHGEVNGETYFFISQEEFCKKVEEGFFAEWKMYNTTNGVWCYGTSTQDIQSASDDNSIIILTPNGYRDIRRKLSCKMRCIYLYANNSTIKNRLSKRGDEPSEADRRVSHDNVDFKDFEYEADKIFYNNDNAELDDVVKRIAEFVQ